MEYRVLTFGLSHTLHQRLKQKLAVVGGELVIASNLWDIVRLCSEELAHLIAFRCQDLSTYDDFVATLRRNNSAPIVVLADSFDADRACSLVDAGADLCFPSDWPLGLLVEHIMASLRRYTSYQPYAGPHKSINVPFTVGDIYIDPSRQIVKINGREVKLRHREYTLLLYFVQNPNKVLTAEQICENAWGMEYIQSVSKSVHELRKRIESNPSQPCYIQTVFRVGYRFTPHSGETCE